MHDFLSGVSFARYQATKKTEVDLGRGNHGKTTEEEEKSKETNNLLGIKETWFPSNMTNYEMQTNLNFSSHYSLENPSIDNLRNFSSKKMENMINVIEKQNTCSVKEL